MESINKTLASKIIQEAVTSSNQSPSPVKCWRCFDTGTVYKSNGEGSGATSCICARRRTAKGLLSLVPPVFNSPKLSRLKPRPELHASQKTVIELVRSYPDDSYLFTGKNGSGKSHIAWALYRHAIAKRKPTAVCVVRDLLGDFRRVELGVADGETLKSPRISAEELRRATKPWFLLLDEFEKARPTEFASEQLFNLLDAAKSFNHQLVVTSNFNAEQLRAHWGRIDPIWGNSILTRLEMCNVVEMF